jgi:hypothetical protein
MLERIRNNFYLESEHFHGEGIDSDFFEGWYYKQATPNQSVIFIPGIFKPKSGSHSDNKRMKPHAFVMAFRYPTTCKCLYYCYDLDEFSFENRQGGAYTIFIGPNTFTPEGFNVDLQADKLVDFPSEEYNNFAARILSQGKQLHDANLDIKFNAFKDLHSTIQGSAQFTGSVKLSQSVMGPFAYIPFLECYHGVVSMYHQIRGSVSWGDETISLDNGIGYIEKDHGYFKVNSGTTFPKVGFGFIAICLTKAQVEALQ